MTGLAKKKIGDGKEMAAEVVGILFMSRDYAHRAHLKTSSYAKHMALNEFYEGIVELADTFAEAAQGKFGKLDIPVAKATGNVDDPIRGIQKHMEMVEMAAEGCGDRGLNNVMDDIVTMYMQTVYKLVELD